MRRGGDPGPKMTLRIIPKLTIFHCHSADALSVTGHMDPYLEPRTLGNFCVRNPPLTNFKITVKPSALD